jgi:prephenate dehydrogenase
LSDDSTNSLKPTLGIIGVGLIGGSIGLAARRRGFFGQILGAGRDRAALDRAKDLGCIDHGHTDLSNVARLADVLVFCTPVDCIASQILAAAGQCRPGTLITDAGSTKAQLVAEVEEHLPAHVVFIGSHPLAGSEKRGAEHARPDLFDNRLTIITHTASTTATAERRATEFWKSLGSRVARMSPERHDEALALTSHLPHLLAAALAGILPDQLRDFTANGFRDSTRIAAGDPSLWVPIFLQNRVGLCEATVGLQNRLIEFQKALLAADEGTLTRLLAEGKKVRDDLGS